MQRFMTVHGPIKEFKKHTLTSEIMYGIIMRRNYISVEQYEAALEQQNNLSCQLDDFFDDRYDIPLDLSTGGEALEGPESVDRPGPCLVWTLCRGLLYLASVYRTKPFAIWNPGQ
jgi:hypothetical protein